MKSTTRLRINVKCWWLTREERKWRRAKVKTRRREKAREIGRLPLRIEAPLRQRPSHRSSVFITRQKDTRKNCCKYLVDHKSGASTSGINVIEINLASTREWVLDTGSCAHLCSNLQELGTRRQVKKGKVQLVVGNKVWSPPLLLALLIFPYLWVDYGIDSWIFRSNCKQKYNMCVMFGQNWILFWNKVWCMNYSKVGLFYASCKISNGLYLLDSDKYFHNISDINKRPRLSSRSTTSKTSIRLQMTQTPSSGDVVNIWKELRNLLNLQEKIWEIKMSVQFLVLAKIVRIFWDITHLKF